MKKCCACHITERLTKIDDKFYCNKHYLRMKFNGTTELKKRKSKNKYEIQDDIAILYTTKNEPFKIDIKHLDKVLKYTWCFSKTGYLVANINKKVVKLHRYILDITDSDIVIDHIDRDKSNNTESNLRECSIKQNSKNVGIKKSNKTGYPGVRLTKYNKWNARITVDKKYIHIGNYDTFEEAVKAKKKLKINIMVILHQLY